MAALTHISFRLGAGTEFEELIARTTRLCEQRLPPDHVEVGFSAATCRDSAPNTAREPAPRREAVP